MAAADDVITVPALRAALGGVGDTEDARLEAHRRAAISHIERWTNRSIIDRTGWASGAGDFTLTGDPVSEIVFDVSDVKDGDFVFRHSPPGTDPSFNYVTLETLTLPSARVSADHALLRILPPDGRRGWGEIITLEFPAPSVIVDRGMAAADIPPQWSEACALIVRALYDGSAFDALASNSALTLLLSPWRPVPGGTRR